MENQVDFECPQCGARNSIRVAEGGDEKASVACSSCQAEMVTVGQLHALIAGQALGLGATELRDDHVPLDGECGERPGI